jgi:renalase
MSSLKPSVSSNSVAIIGAGISGLACARSLVDHGFNVTVFEKSRGVGGRTAARRLKDGVSIDHGAQYFTVRNDLFRTQVERWMSAGVVAVWNGRIGRLEHGQFDWGESETTRYVGVPAMNAMCRSLAIDIPLRLHSRLGTVRRKGRAWAVENENAESLGMFDYVLSSAPPSQTAKLLAAAPIIAKAAQTIRMQSCWAVMLTFGKSLGFELDGAFVEDSPLSWVARNSSKPGRPDLPETWVLHAGAEWSRDCLECHPDALSASLLEAFWQSLDVPAAKPTLARAHLWRYALPATPSEIYCLFDADLRIGACGDWCGGPRIEGAFLSGRSLADVVVQNYEDSIR